MEEEQYSSESPASSPYVSDDNNSGSECIVYASEDNKDTEYVHAESGTDEEYIEMLSVKGVRLYPKSFEDSIVRKNSYILDSLKKYISEDDAVLYGSESMTRLFQPRHTKPTELLFDICVFRKSSPVLVLTICTNETEDIAIYNSDLARTITITVRKHVASNFSLVHGILNDDTHLSQSGFNSELDRLRLHAEMISIPQSLDMTEKLWKSILSIFLTTIVRRNIDSRRTKIGVGTFAHKDDSSVRTKSSGYASCTETCSDISSDYTSEDESGKSGPKGNVDKWVEEQNRWPWIHEPCSRCTLVEKTYINSSMDPNIFVVHLERDSIITGPKKKCRNRSIMRKTVQKIEKIVSALRNTAGGVLLLHVNGQKESDSSLTHLHDFIDKRLQKLIDDGKLFEQVYDISWWSNLPKINQNADFVEIKVNIPASRVSTVDFNTKITTGSRIDNPSTQNMLCLLSQTASVSQTVPVARGIANLKQIHEEQNTILKPSILSLEKTSDASHVVKYILFKMKLLNAITAFSKNPYGGSFFIGIKTEKNEKEDCDTILLREDGFQFKFSQRTFEETLRKHLKSTMCVLQLNGAFGQFPNDLVSVHFHEVDNSIPQKYVLEVAIGYFSGIVFDDLRGPRAYIVDKGMVVRMEKSKWIEMLRPEVLAM